MTGLSIPVLVELLDINTPVNPVFEPYWFNSDEYSRKQNAKGTLFLYQKDTNQVFLRLYDKENRKVSPWRAPFGALEFSEKIVLPVLYEFVKEVLQKAKEMGAKHVQLVAPPECYDLGKADLMDEVLIHAGFSVSVTELNYHLDTSMGAFEDFIHESERRRLKKSLNAGFECRLETKPDIAQLHQLISACRQRKGYPLSMNVSDFEKMFDDFPDHYLPFVVWDKDTMIAAAIGVKASSTILYNFLPADHPDYLAYSPVVLLNKTIYDYCCQNGYGIYDLGIATSGGKRNEGLIRFKEHLGGILSHKYTYEINF